MRKQGTIMATSTTVLLLSAYETPALGKRRQGLTVAAHNAGKFSSQTYAEKIKDSLKAHGWVVPETAKKIAISKRDFYRLDYSRSGVYEAWFCTAVKGYILEFLFTGASQDDLQKLTHSLDSVRFD